jgi:hypothetical protein
MRIFFRTIGAALSKAWLAGAFSSVFAAIRSRSEVGSGT